MPHVAARMLRCALPQAPTAVRVLLPTEFEGNVDSLDVAERFVKQVVLGVPRLRQKLAVMLSTITIADTLNTVISGLVSVRTACTEVCASPGVRGTRR